MEDSPCFLKHLKNPNSPFLPPKALVLDLSFDTEMPDPRQNMESLINNLNTLFQKSQSQQPVPEAPQESISRARPCSKDKYFKEKELIDLQFSRFDQSLQDSKNALKSK